MSERKAAIGQLVSRLATLKLQIDTDIKELESNDYEPSRETVETIARHFGDDFYEVNASLQRILYLSEIPDPPPSTIKFDIDTA